jgi:sugar lactone lactonase YvrE
MPAKHTVDAKVQTLMTGLAMGESPRWHEGRLWLADWGAQEILAINIQGKSDVVVRVPFALPFCMDWLLNGTLLIVSGSEGLLMRRERDGSLVTHADLHGFSENG